MQVLNFSQASRYNTVKRLRYVFLVLRTLKYLKKSQYVYLLLNKFNLWVKSLSLKYSLDSSYTEIFGPAEQGLFFVYKSERDFERTPLIKNLCLQPTIERQDELCSFTQNEITFNFLNKACSFSNKNFNWVADNESKLWNYHLHYFECLSSTALSNPQKTWLIQHWFLHNSKGKDNAWDAYPMSQRIMHLAKWMMSQRLPDKVSDFLSILMWLHVKCLSKNIEYHLQGNHLLKNAIALWWGASLFQGSEAEHIKSKAWKLLHKELHKQFLDDGGHIEGSPFYHAQILVLLLDSYNLASSNNWLVEKVLLHYVCEKALRWISHVEMPDQYYPLFNDSVLCRDFQPYRLQAYAEALGLLDSWKVSQTTQAFELKDSGFYGVRDGNNMLIATIANVQPSYQPGHHHNDMLSYELVLAGQRVVVDTGVFNYSNDETRQYCRSTAAHNTLVMMNQEQSEIWKSFRVGRRARITHAQLQRITYSQTKILGAHNGFNFLPNKPVHCREFFVDNSEKSYAVRDVLVAERDTLQGLKFFNRKPDEDDGYVHTVASSIHLSPNHYITSVFQPFLHQTEGIDHREDVLGIAAQGEAVIMSKHSSKPVAKLHWSGATLRVDKSQYYPEFGVVKNNQNIVLIAVGKLPITIEYKFVYQTV